MCLAWSTNPQYEKNMANVPQHLFFSALGPETEGEITCKLGKNKIRFDL